MYLSDLGPFRRVIKKITACLMRLQPGDCDKLANGRDDYEVIMVTHAWESLMKWRSDTDRWSQGSQAERHFIHDSHACVTMITS